MENKNYSLDVMVSNYRLTILKLTAERGFGDVGNFDFKDGVLFFRNTQYKWFVLDEYNGRLLPIHFDSVSFELEKFMRAKGLMNMLA